MMHITNNNKLDVTLYRRHGWKMRGEQVGTQNITAVEVAGRPCFG